MAFMPFENHCLEKSELEFAPSSLEMTRDAVVGPGDIPSDLDLGRFRTPSHLASRQDLADRLDEGVDVVDAPLVNQGELGSGQFAERLLVARGEGLAESDK